MYDLDYYCEDEVEEAVKGIVFSAVEEKIGEISALSRINQEFLDDVEEEIRFRFDMSRLAVDLIDLCLTKGSTGAINVSLNYYITETGEEAVLEYELCVSV